MALIQDILVEVVDAALEGAGLLGSSVLLVFLIIDDVLVLSPFKVLVLSLIHI